MSDAAARIDGLLHRAARVHLAADEAITLAEAALGTGREHEALPFVAAAASRGPDRVRVWQWAGLLARSLGEHRMAIDAFARAARLAPADPLIAHSQARVALEAGLEAISLFERARTLGPTDAEVHLGLASARCAAGCWEQALAELEQLLAGAPGWIAGHETACKIRWTFGDPDDFTTTIERALASQPRSVALWAALFAQLLHAGQHEDVLRAAEKARSNIGDHLVVSANAAAALSELGHFPQADRLYARIKDHEDGSLLVRRVRHLLRAGRAEQALAAAEPVLQTAEAPLVWPYVSLGWRLTNDPRATWLEADEAFVRTVDLADRLPAHDEFAALLRSLHVSRHQPLDQSLRGGTQTDGMLFERIEPQITAVRETIRRAVADYVAQLPPADPAHPLLRQRRDRRPRFSGAWSVRLTGSGYHANHNHPAGWISSALYVALPDRQPEQRSDAGWLVLGEPEPQLGLPLGALHTIEPKPGRLVLFPSTMWHGTRAFSTGERLTVAFDVARPGLAH